MRFPKLPAKSVRNTAKGVAGVAALGVGLSAITGALPGTQGVPDAIGNLLTSGLNGAASTFNMLPLYVGGAAVVALLVLLK